MQFNIVDIQSMDLVRNFKVYVAQFNNDDNGKIELGHARDCHPVLQGVVPFLSFQYKCAEKLITATAGHIGTRVLWALPEIQIIEQAYPMIYKSRNEKLRREFEMRTEFDWGTSKVKQKQLSLFEADLNQLRRLGQITRISSGILYQLSVMAGLLECDEVIDEDNNVMYGLVRKYFETVKLKQTDTLGILSRIVPYEPEKGKRYRLKDLFNEYLPKKEMQ